ncbi:hypothetical protein GCM10010327_26320 [Streptomyces nitrosporeus]|nr:hypothetical protein GCM10010327_26320 [Streptomyces nitrosporeus]
MINGLPFRQRTGIPWRDLPMRFGKWKAVHDRHRRWSADGTWDRISRAVQADAGSEGRPDRTMATGGLDGLPGAPARGRSILSRDKAYNSRHNRRCLRRRQIRHTLPERRDQQPTGKTAVAKAGGQPASTGPGMPAGTRSSARSTPPRASVPHPLDSANGLTSSTAR